MVEKRLEKFVWAEFAAILHRVLKKTKCIPTLHNVGVCILNFITLFYNLLAVPGHSGD
jgi:hypothetical protein